jgi:hypothetical protein
LKTIAEFEVRRVTGRKVPIRMNQPDAIARAKRPVLPRREVVDFDEVPLLPIEAQDLSESDAARPDQFDKITRPEAISLFRGCSIVYDYRV